MSSRDDDVLWAAVGFGFGIWLFFHGFKELRRKRLIENIPTSTVRGLAMGLVELAGVVRPTTILRSPITKTECAAYKFKVEEYRSSGKSGRWVTLVQSDSFSCPFYLEDSTGKVKVYPFGSELYWQPDYEFKNGFGESFPENLNIFMLEMGISSRNLFFTKRMRFTEWYLQDNSPIYVLGTAKLDDAQAISVDQNALADRLEKLKKDPEFLKEADTDQNGYVSGEEWEAAAARTACINAIGPADSAQKEGQLSGLLKNVFAVAENYPDLKANQNFTQLQQRVSYLESQIADRREFYNDSVNSYNIRIHQIPDMFVAGMMNLNDKELFKVSEEDKKDVDMHMELPK